MQVPSVAQLPLQNASTQTKVDDAAFKACLQQVTSHTTRRPHRPFFTIVRRKSFIPGWLYMLVHPTCHTASKERPMLVALLSHSSWGAIGEYGCAAQL
eukprot:4945406-Amphidinium_carterae.1